MNWSSVFPNVLLMAVILVIVYIFKVVIESYLRSKHEKQKVKYLGMDPKQAMVDEILDALHVYHNMAVVLHTTYVILGFIAIISSVLVTSLIGSPSTTTTFTFQVTDLAHFLSFVSTAALTLITAFNLGNKSNNCRKAWRYLSYFLAQYQMNIVEAKDLLKAHDDAEKMIGGVDFQYNV